MLIASWKKLKEYNCQEYFPGHGSKFEVEKLNNCFNNLNNQV